MFYRDSQHIYRARPLDAFAWLVHGFGTRSSNGFGPVTTLRQIHSGHVIFAAGRGGCLGEGDALVDNTPGALLGVKTADCLPILLVDTAHRAVGVVHAGWRGTVRNVTHMALETMAARFSTRAPDVHAAIGPGIGKCCFEVGPEVAAEFASAETRIDLVEENRRQLLLAGVPERQIYAARLCTVCGGEEFCSYRREGRHAGRMLSVAGIR